MKTSYPPSDTKSMILRCFFRLSRKPKNKKLMKISSKRKRKKKEGRSIIIMTMRKSKIS